MSDDSVIPVLIVGAGPAGLVAALTLRKNGIPVRIIEKAPRVQVGQRGAGMMPRSQELYKFLGILDDIRAKAVRVVPMRFYKLPEGIEPIVTFPVDPAVAPTPSRPYGNIFMLGQNNTEEILRTHLEGHGCQVELGTALHSFQQADDHVLAQVMKKEGDQETIETVKCRWLVGADGARGVVRKQLGLPFNGETLGVTYHLVNGDLQIKGLDGNHWHYWGDMSTTLITLRATEEDDIFALSMGGRVDHAKIVAERAELERILRVGTGRTDIELGKVRYVAEYRPQVRMAETFRKGRVLVAGDAAHIHSPFGGQGMNSSVQDAINLGWKISLVEKGVAAPSLLDSYSEERIPVIAEMLKKSTKLFNEAMQGKSDGSSGDKAWFRGGELHMFGVNCRWSSIVVDERTPKEDTPVDPYGVALYSSATIARAGERAPDAPGLVVLGPAEDAGSSQAQTSTSLFDIFAPSYHTALIFSDGTDKAEQIVLQLRAYPTGLVRKVLVYNDSNAVTTPSGADMSVVDQYGHAHEGYHVQRDEFMIVVVRPDGVIGAISRSTEGVKRYFAGVFSAY